MYFQMLSDPEASYLLVFTQGFQHSKQAVQPFITPVTNYILLAHVNADYKLLVTPNNVCLCNPHRLLSTYIQVQRVYSCSLYNTSMHLHIPADCLQQSYQEIPCPSCLEQDNNNVHLTKLVHNYVQVHIYI